MWLLYSIRNVMFFFTWHLTRTLADTNPLNGQCLRVLPMDLKGFLTTKRNASNHILELSGIEPEMLFWFARKYNFSYELLNYIAPLQDDSSFRRGAINYTLNGEVDFLLGTLAPTAERYKKIDYTTFFINEPSGLLIPFPETAANIAAVIHPFTFKVWMSFLGSLFLVSISLYAINRGQCLINKSFKKDNSTIVNKNSRIASFGRVVQYVVEVAVSRGVRCFNTSFEIRIIGAVWCLACFILAQAYNVELISYIMAPNRKPIIKSPYDIPKVPGLKLTVDRGYPIDAALMATKTGVFKDLADTLRSEPDLRCNATADCLKKVQGGLHVYANGVPILHKIIDGDWKETRTCHYLIAKEPFDKVLPAALGFPKGSRYTDSISKGILQLSEAGLLNHWMDESFEKRDRCLKKFKDKTPISPRLTLQNMSSPFIVLVIGYIIALVAFIGEKIANFLLNKKPAANLVVQPVDVAPLEVIIMQDLEEAEIISEEKKEITDEALDLNKETAIEKTIEEIQKIKQSEPVAKPVVQSVVATPLEVLIIQLIQDLEEAENTSKEKKENKIEQTLDINKE